MLTRRFLKSILVVAGVIGALGAACAQEKLPPVMPKVQETPVPPLVGLPAPPSVPADVSSKPLTADEAARIALHYQPNVEIAALAVTAAQGRTEQARSALLPQLGVSGNYTISRGSAVGGVGSQSSGAAGTSAGLITGISGYTASTTLNQLIFDFNHTRDMVEQARSLERAAGAGLTVTQSDTVYQTKQAFYTYAQDLRLVEVNEESLKDQQEHLALAQARVRAGIGIPLDVVMAETAVADAILNLIVASTNASLARVNLALVMGIDPRTPIQAAETGEPAVNVDDINSLIVSALKNRPEIAQAAINTQAARFALGAARTTDYPSFGAFANFFDRGGNSLAGNSTTIGVTLAWTPFDSGFTAGKIKEAKADLDTTAVQMRGVQLTVISDVSQAYLNLKTAEQRVTTSESEAFNAKEALRLAQGRYRSGTGVFLDVLDDEAALVTANVNLVNARSGVDQALAAMSHALGKGV